MSKKKAPKSNRKSDKAKNKKKSDKAETKSRNKATKAKAGKAKRSDERVEQFVDLHDVSYDDLAMAGLGLLATTLPAKKHKGQVKKAAKRFSQLVDRGQRMTIATVSSTAMLSPGEALAPVISHQACGDGWYTVEIDDVEVERLQGEENAAMRAGELLANYAALEGAEQRPGTTAIIHSGGGWYNVFVPVCPSIGCGANKPSPIVMATSPTERSGPAAG